MWLKEPQRKPSNPTTKMSCDPPAVLELAKRLPDLAFSMEPEKRLLLLKTICQNWKLDKEKLAADYESPWDLMAMEVTKENRGGRWDLAGNELRVKRRVKPSYSLLPDPAKATLGQRLRFLRRKLGLSIKDMRLKVRLAESAIARIERDEARH